MSHRDPAPLTSRHVAALIRSAGRELGYGLLTVRAELRAWRARARTIPDAEIRALVLQGMDEGRALVDGAALFWTLPERRSGELLRALVALQTLLNFLDLPPGTLEYVVDRNPHKVGKYMPGVRLPIRSVDELLADQPDYLMLLAWNFAAEIIDQNREYTRRGGRFILPVPEPVIV